MNHYFGVGLRPKRVASLDQLFAQDVVVLDDPVVNDRNAPRTIFVRMRVLVGWRPVCCPSRVPDAGVPAKGPGVDLSGQNVQLAGPASIAKHPIRNDRDPGRVVTSVFEAGHALQ